MPVKTKYYYYRLGDDRLEFSHIKSTFAEKQIRSLLKKFEKTHQAYYTDEFMELLKKHDPKAELIDVMKISF